MTNTIFLDHKFHRRVQRLIDLKKVEDKGITIDNKGKVIVHCITGEVIEDSNNNSKFEINNFKYRCT
jgi:hypothetical protein